MSTTTTQKIAAKGTNKTTGGSSAIWRSKDAAVVGKTTTNAAAPGKLLFMAKLNAEE